MQRAWITESLHGGEICPGESSDLNRLWLRKKPTFSVKLLRLGVCLSQQRKSAYSDATHMDPFCSCYQHFTIISQYTIISH